MTWMSPKGLGTFCVLFVLGFLAQSIPTDVQAQGVVVVVSPESATVAVNRSVQFTATVTGTDSTRVIWSVDGGEINGTMTVAGVYTAPAVVPQSVTVIVRAKSVADTTAQGTATVTVRGLVLSAPEEVRVAPKMNTDRKSFANYIFWKAPADGGFFIHPTDTTGWHKNPEVPADSHSRPSSGGWFRGSIDRTLVFTATEAGRVGYGRPTRPSLRVRCQVDDVRAPLLGEINIGGDYVDMNGRQHPAYTPGDPIEVELNPGKVNFGFTVSFSEGWVDSNAVFRVGLEVFEGYHIFRGLCPVCGPESDMINIGEISSEDAFRREMFDSLYFDAMLPALRTRGVYTLPEGNPGLGSVIDIRDRSIHPNGRLGPDEFIWVDYNAFNGFSYNYLVTTFDKGYNVLSTSQGLQKFDSCPVEKGENCPCPPQLVTVTTKVTPLADLPQVYAVPNPYRDPAGTTQNTTANYHNFPDNKMRFVNVPKRCTLRIYTPAGDLVWEHMPEDGDGSGVVEWDTNNSSGEPVASGVYIYRVDGNSKSWMYGRIVIIR